MCSNEGILHKCHIRKKSQCETQPYSRTIPLGKHAILENLIGKDRKKKIFKQYKGHLSFNDHKFKYNQ